nr:hypothetical protein [Lactiplantibacillus plantarum]
MVPFVIPRIIGQLWRLFMIFVDLNEVVLQIEAQYQKFVALVGGKPDYFEGHAVELK